MDKYKKDKDSMDDKKSGGAGSKLSGTKFRT